MFMHIKAAWGISNQQCGMLVSAVYWSIVLLTFPVSIFIDRWSRRKSIGIMAIVWSLATALCALTGNFTQLLLARVLIGVGEAGYAPGGAAMISGLYPQRKRAQMLGLWNASIPLGSAIGVGLGGIIAATLGWKHAFGLVAIPGLAIAILFYMIKDYKTAPIVLAKSDSTAFQMVSEFASKPSYLYVTFGLAAVIFVTTALLTWLPSFFMDLYSNIDEKAAGLKAGSVMLLAIVGAPLGGFLSDYWSKRNIKARMLFPAISTLISSIILFIAINYPPGQIQYAIFLLFGVCVIAFAPAAVAVTQDVVQAGLRAVSYSIAVVIQNSIGAGLAPVVLGVLYDKYDIKTAFQILPVVLVVGATLFYLGSKHYVSDMEKVKVVAVEAE
jgi:MFS family permease